MKVEIDANWVMAACAVLTVILAVGLFLWKLIDSKLNGIDKKLEEAARSWSNKFEGHVREFAELKGRFDEMTRDR